MDETTFKELQKISTYKFIEANKPIARSGNVAFKVYLLVSGIIRAYIRTENGKEFNKNIFIPSSFVGSFTSLIKGKPSKLTYETLTDCKLYEIDFKEFIKLCHKDITISNLYNKILEQVFMAYEERQLELIAIDSKERYMRLKRRIPNIDSLIPQYHIASYLSITPVQLSRIRKNLKLTS